MKKNMSVASSRTVWVLRGAFALVFLFLSMICVSSYFKNLEFSKRELVLENFSHQFNLFSDALQKVSHQAHLTEDFLLESTQKSSSFSSVEYAKFTKQKQDINSVVTRAVLCLTSLRDTWNSSDPEFLALVRKELRVVYPFAIYHQLFDRNSFALVSDQNQLSVKIEELEAHFETGIENSLLHIRDVLNEHGETLEEAKQEMVSNFLMLLGVSLVVIALFIFIPMDFMIRRLLVGFEKKSNEAEKALLEAQQADRAKSEFLATMSHEIRTPMNGVLGMAELLNKTDLDERQKTFSNVILRSGNALLGIINDILDFSKIDAQQLQLQEDICDVSELVGEVVTLLSIKANEKDVELVMRIQPNVPKGVSIDGVRLRQVIINILGNAIKFTEIGHVLVKVSSLESDKADHTRLQFEIEDTGIGISKDKITHIFDKFSQVDSSNTRRFEGTGLGLAISARLVEMMGGKIDVCSEFGVGSKFFFSLDLPVVNSESFEKLIVTDSNIQARALIVDDNEVNRTILVEQLSSWGYECVAVESGVMALAFLKAAQSQYGIKMDVVILDFQMPEMTGADVLKEIRKTAVIADTKVLLLSSVDQTSLTDLLKEYELDGHLSKPVRGPDLKVIIEKILMGSQVTNLRLAAHALAEPQGQSIILPVIATAISTDQTSINNNMPVRQENNELDILVCEDNEVNQLVISQYLEMTKFTYKIVANGKLGVSEWEASNPRLILMDVSMPEMNGREATTRIRDIETERAIGRTPIIGVTAHAQVKDREECLESGMDDVLTKPLSSDDLIKMLDSWMDSNDLKKIASSA